MSQKANEAIRNYLHNLSKGVINLSEKQANYIIELVETNPTEVFIIQKFKFNAVLGSYEHIQDIKWDKEKIECKIGMLNGAKQYKGFYRFNCIELQWEFYTVNPNLF